MKIPIRWCALCGGKIDQENTGEPYLPFKEKTICSSCYIELINEIYGMAGYGDGGIIHLIFQESLKSSHNRSRRIPIKNYKKTLKSLLHKYNFKCVECGATENLTIDHIKPVSKGGTDDILNLQIMCKPCNSRKGAKWDG